MALNGASANRTTRQPCGTTDATALSQWCEHPSRLHTPPKTPLPVSVWPTPASTATRTKLPHVCHTDLDAARPLFAFAQVTGLRPKAVQLAENEPLSIPTPATRRGPRPAFPLVRALSRTWWQVKDSNLRSFRDGFTVHSHWP